MKAPYLFWCFQESACLYYIINSVHFSVQYPDIFPERGTRILSVDVLFRISQALDTSIDWLVFDSVENEHMLSRIENMLKNADKNKVSTFLNTVRVLADNIDKL